MPKNKQNTKLCNLDKDDQIRCLTKIIYSLVGYGAAIPMINSTYEEYMDMKNAMDSET